ncbi:hypothetical protein CMUS01_04047 [Colletotrichum musicola]|uniref:2EXR domain-containing protein n=1 Tax=Colletotrichum musicola TaxID=2175873 RepID=A0A8H6NPJ8_9PEZI|nr:hypothetical protein CMUS01_04047 [Colletotrichum musicola]
MAAPSWGFKKIPTEIRYEIYKMTIKPRVVPIKEVISKTDDELRQWLRTAELPYVDEKWQPFIEFNMGRLRSCPGVGLALLQLSLEAAGASPQIPKRSFLMRNPYMAWAFGCKSELYSNAPIPALLHVWRESREELRRLGYELAFATPCAPKPLTWFNFKLDILYFPDISSRNEYTKVHPPVRPADLERVERLALWYQGFLRPNRLVRILETLGANESRTLKELFCVDWTFAEIKDWPGITGDCADKDLIPVKIEATEYETFPDNMSPHGVLHYFDGNELLADFIRRGTPLSPPGFYEFCLRRIKFSMRRDYQALVDKERILSHDTDFPRGTARWNRIKLRIVHMLPQMTLKGVEERRQRIAKARHSWYQDAVFRWAQGWPSYHAWGCGNLERFYRELSDQQDLRAVSAL